MFIIYRLNWYHFPSNNLIRGFELEEKSIDTKRKIPLRFLCLFPSKQWAFEIKVDRIQIGGVKLVTLNDCDNDFVSQNSMLYKYLFVQFLSKHHCNPFQKKARKATPIVVLFTYSICQIEVMWKSWMEQQAKKVDEMEYHLRRTHAIAGIWMIDERIGVRVFSFVQEIQVKKGNIRLQNAVHLDDSLSLTLPILHAVNFKLHIKKVVEALLNGINESDIIYRSLYLVCLQLMGTICTGIPSFVRNAHTHRDTHTRHRRYEDIWDWANGHNYIHTKQPHTNHKF